MKYYSCWVAAVLLCTALSTGATPPKSLDPAPCPPPVSQPPTS
jgi:hypothetical protein